MYEFLYNSLNLGQCQLLVESISCDLVFARNRLLSLLNKLTVELGINVTFILPVCKCVNLLCKSWTFQRLYCKNKIPRINYNILLLFGVTIRPADARFFSLGVVHVVFIRSHDTSG